MRRLGIIPAAGKANRFGGVLKEMLPVRNDTLLRRSLNAMIAARVDNCLLITNREKIQHHAHHLELWRVYYAVQLGQQDLWGAISESLSIHGDMNLFCMPDTYFPLDALVGLDEGEFNLGLFETDMPERFGVLTDDCIADKTNMKPGIYKAWGVLSWTGRVAEYWLDHISEIKNHTQAFNMAMAKFGYKTKPLAYYHDLASWEDYRALIAEVTNE